MKQPNIHPAFSGLAAIILLTALTTSTAPGKGKPATPPKKAKGVMSQEQASSFARLALKGLQKEYPNKPADVLNSDRDVKSLREMHGHWMLVRLPRLFPDLPEKKQARAVLAVHLTAKNLRAEVDYFARPNSQSFERPYGWQWETAHKGNCGSSRFLVGNFRPGKARNPSYFQGKQSSPRREIVS